MAWPWIIAGGLALWLLSDKTIGKTRKVLETWVPEDFYDRELEYRQDLAKALRSILPAAFVIEEHGHGRGRRDIRVQSLESGSAVAIELKYRLRTSNEVSRLLGQVVRYQDDVAALFIVLVDPEPNLLAELAQKVRSSFEEDRVEMFVVEQHQWEAE